MRVFNLVLKYIFIFISSKGCGFVYNQLCLLFSIFVQVLFLLHI